MFLLLFNILSKLTSYYSLACEFLIKMMLRLIRLYLLRKYNAILLLCTHNNEKTN